MSASQIRKLVCPPSLCGTFRHLSTTAPDPHPPSKRGADPEKPSSRREESVQLHSIGADSAATALRAFFLPRRAFFLPAFFPAFLPAFLPTFLLAFLPTRFATRLLAFLDAFFFAERFDAFFAAMFFLPPAIRGRTSRDEHPRYVARRILPPIAMCQRKMCNGACEFTSFPTFPPRNYFIRSLCLVDGRPRSPPKSDVRKSLRPASKSLESRMFSGVLTTDAEAG